MRTIADSTRRTIHATGLDELHKTQLPFAGAPYCCLIWDHEGLSGRDSHSATALRLVTSGCRYVVCGGANCEAWHDAIDEECLIVGEDGTVVERSLVMTTWHDGEPPEDVAEFFLNCTSVENIEFTRYLVVHVGTGPLRQVLEAAVRANALESGAV